MKDVKEELIEAIGDFTCCWGGCCGHPELDKAMELAHKLKEEDTEDDNPTNMLVRAGYLFSLATRLPAEDREMVRQAARSLQYAANPPPKDETKLRAALADFMSDWCILGSEEGRPAGDDPRESDVDELISIFRNRG